LTIDLVSLLEIAKMKKTTMKRRKNATRSGPPATVPPVSELLRPTAPSIGRAQMEVKISDTSTTAAAITWSSAPIDLFAPAQGVSVNQRVGDECNLIAWELRLVCNQNGTGTAMRVIIWQYGDDTATGVPAVADIVQGGGTAQVVVGSYNYNAQEQREIVIIHDSLHPIPPSSSDPIVLYLKGALNSRVKFNAGAVTGTGKVYASIMSNVAAGPLVQHYARLFYTDP
jgi:hypothetical protein